MEELLTRYQEIKDQLDVYQAKLEKYKKKIEKEMANQGLDKYETKQWALKKQSQERMMLSKKNVPETVWTQYAQPHKVEFLSIRKKPSPKS
jgi:hypothetical protein